jgi:hypothetical protein
MDCLKLCVCVSFSLAQFSKLNPQNYCELLSEEEEEAENERSLFCSRLVVAISVFVI